MIMMTRNKASETEKKRRKQKGKSSKTNHCAVVRHRPSSRHPPLHPRHVPSHHRARQRHRRRVERRLSGVRQERHSGQSNREVAASASAQAQSGRSLRAASHAPCVAQSRRREARPGLTRVLEWRTRRGSAAAQQRPLSPLHHHCRCHCAVSASVRLSSPRSALCCPAIRVPVRWPCVRLWATGRSAVWRRRSGTCWPTRGCRSTTCATSRGRAGAEPRGLDGQEGVSVA